MRTDNIVVRHADNAHIIPHQNIHVIDKDYLLSDDFGKFVEAVCKK